MALTRRSGSRFTASIWPGFVDAMTALLLVVMFVLTIFMVMQFVLQETISGQDKRLDELSGQVASLAEALGLEQRENTRLQDRVGELSSTLDAANARSRQQDDVINALLADQDAANARIADFEEQVASLLAQRDDLTTRVSALGQELENSQENLRGARASIDALEAAKALEISQKEAAQLALAQARSEIDAQTEAARLAAAKREALEALIADLKSEKASLETQLTDEEALRLAEAAAVEALRERLKNADDELTAMTLALEKRRQEAEDTLSLLAAARAAEQDLADQLQALQDRNLSEAEKQRLLLATAQDLLSQEQALNAENQRKLELLNQQTAALRQQLRQLQGLLDSSRQADAESQVQIANLGSELNQALARATAAEREKRKLEEAERKRLEAEANSLRSYRSEFFGRMRAILGDRPGIEIVGDRFVFSSEILFTPGSAELGLQGQKQISDLAFAIKQLGVQIPTDLNWILRVDGHTDKIPIRSARFADNWELSQARALSVVRYLIEQEGVPANRLAAAGFGEFHPIDSGDSPEALAKNRRIELKFTEQ